MIIFASDLLANSVTTRGGYLTMNSIGGNTYEAESAIIISAAPSSADFLRIDWGDGNVQAEFSILHHNLLTTGIRQLPACIQLCSFLWTSPTTRHPNTLLYGHSTCEVLIDAGQSVSIDEGDHSAAIGVFPDLSGEFVTFQFADVQSRILRIYDQAGREIYNRQSNDTQIIFATNEFTRDCISIQWLIMQKKRPAES